MGRFNDVVNFVSRWGFLKGIALVSSWYRLVVSVPFSPYTPQKVVKPTELNDLFGCHETKISVEFYKLRARRFKLAPANNVN